ncbi:phosphoenolpyruvate carboxykinase (ATP) [Candidatus Sumerlaeota bacterium]|nr:phosphoenolpyruvate carboxykinase (ATP) [Candidatus Sumerlaeota bacterium]
MSFSLEKYGITVEHVYRNPSIAKTYHLALQWPRNFIANNGALIAFSGAKTGRSPKDKRVVEDPVSKEHIWWGSINIPVSEESFAILRDTATNSLNARRNYVYCIDGFAAWDLKHRLKVRVICGRAYHALFMRNMLIRPTEEELANFGEPDWVIYNGGQTKASAHIPGLTGDTSVDINFKSREMVILGSEYAGEMKKGVFTVLNYSLPLAGVLSMHCSANEGKDGDTALFFGLSGTGKTTLSADPQRRLIGDDEHGWSDDGIFNFEGGCYAKCINLSEEKEPEIFQAIRFGSVLENVTFDEETHEVDYKDASITENTRCSYPLEYIPNVKLPAVGGHPRNIIFLTADAFGVLPPVSKLTPGQAMYHFISGYTAKVAGTEVGVTEPQATFSACFGAAFLVWHPTKYAELLKQKITEHNSHVWFVNTGWTGGSYGVGKRFDLKHTRAIINAILEGRFEGTTFERDPIFGLNIPLECPGVPAQALRPRDSWADGAAYDETANKLATMFHKNFEKYKDRASQEILDGGPLAGR